jgi:hypothetical protein
MDAGAAADTIAAEAAGHAEHAAGEEAGKAALTPAGL